MIELNQADQSADFGFVIGGENVTVLRNVASRNGLDYASALKDGFVVIGAAGVFDRNRSFHNAGYGIRGMSALQDNVYTDNLCGDNRFGDSDPPGLCR